MSRGLRVAPCHAPCVHHDHPRGPNDGASPSRASLMTACLATRGGNFNLQKLSQSSICLHRPLTDTAGPARQLGSWSHEAGIPADNAPFRSAHAVLQSAGRHEPPSRAPLRLTYRQTGARLSNFYMCTSWPWCLTRQRSASWVTAWVARALAASDRKPDGPQ